ncbi:uncharacterized protein VP01_8294g1 [Puccinia sorghi]|uniref:Retrotransposon gag domain-containing protein n=1 Tax=Puccinia sorghi TaxID=27349 RepID=A0A0L6U9Q9_9BASI|nr:uncharacterized protein VP01_8294g1 [Puccinia sorghi]
MDALNAGHDKMMCMLAKECAQQIATEESLCQTQAHLNSAPRHFNRTRDAAAKSFVGQILLHTVNPKKFPTDSSKVAFAVLFMTEYRATWSQPYLMMVFNAEEVAFNEFLDDFKSSFFDHNRQHHAEVALRSLCQTGTVSAYTQDFNSHAQKVGWADTCHVSNFWLCFKSKRYSTKNLLIHLDARHSTNESLKFVESNALMLFEL